MSPDAAKLKPKRLALTVLVATRDIPKLGEALESNTPPTPFKTSVVRLGPVD